ncbi:MAG: glycosyltransferase family 4 protein [Victivallales bacterium]|nr:glycosyltransferase family 4 protein [Victivallales bacterium]
MRILFLDCAPFMGGAQESLWTLLTEFRSHSLPTALVCANDELLNRATAYGIPVWRIHCRHWPATIRGCRDYFADRRQSRATMVAAIQEFKPECLCFNTVRSALLYGRHWSVPWIIHDRDIRMPWVVPLLLSRGKAHVISVSEAVADKWRRWIRREDLAVLPNAFDIENLRLSSAGLLERHADGVISLAMVADFSSWKGHGDFVNAVEKLHQRFSALHGVIKGRVRDSQGGFLRDALERDIKRRHLQDVIEVNDREESALPVIAGSDIVVSTALNEPFGRVAVEALALGKPVVAVRSGGLTDILEHCGAATLVTPGRLDELVAAISSWLPRERREEVQEKARLHAMSYDVSNIFPKFLDLVTTFCK